MWMLRQGVFTLLKYLGWVIWGNESTSEHYVSHGQGTDVGMFYSSGRGEEVWPVRDRVVLQPGVPGQAVEGAQGGLRPRVGSQEARLLKVYVLVNSTVCRYVQTDAFEYEGVLMLIWRPAHCKGVL